MKNKLPSFMDRCRWVGERNEVVRLGRVGLYDMDEHNYFYHIDYKVTKCKISLCSWFLTWIFFSIL